MLVMPNFEEYLHPELYDLENTDFETEVSFLLSFIQTAGGPVLELGCGTGRMTIPLAQQGIEITGLDVVPEMLARARQKAAGLPIQWVQADARDFHLGQKFSFIFEIGSVFMHMLTNADQAAYLRCVREHLAPGGQFVLSLWFPHPDSLEDVLEEKEWFSYLDEQGRTVRVSGTEQYDELTQVKVETAIRRILNADGTETVYEAPLALRYTFPQEMEALLDYADFEVQARYGGPDRSPLTGESRLMLFVCTRRLG